MFGPKTKKKNAFFSNFGPCLSPIVLCWIRPLFFFFFFCFSSLASQQFGPRFSYPLSLYAYFRILTISFVFHASATFFFLMLAFEIGTITPPVLNSTRNLLPIRTSTVKLSVCLPLPINQCIGSEYILAKNVKWAFVVFILPKEFSLSHRQLWLFLAFFWFSISMHFFFFF